MEEVREGMGEHTHTSLEQPPRTQSRVTGVFEEPGEAYLCRQSRGVYTPGINRWPQVVPAGLSTQHNLAAAKPAHWDGGSLWLLFIVSWLPGRGEGKDEAYGEVDVNCPFWPSLIWKWTSTLRAFILFYFFLGAALGRSRSKCQWELAGYRGWCWGAGGLMGKQQPPVTMSVLRHQPLPMGDGVPGGWWGAEWSHKVGSLTQALGTLWGCCGLVLLSPA